MRWSTWRRRRSRARARSVNRQPVERRRARRRSFSGVVFKVQANMDPSHRDRIAFVRMASGKYTPGMKLKVQRTAKELRPDLAWSPSCRSAARRWTRPIAGDIIGFTTHGGVQLGDTITDGANLQYTGLPFFAPELFMTVMLRNPLRTKQLQQGLAQLGEEGAIQVFRPQIGGADAAGRGGPAAVRGGAAPAEGRVRRRRAAGGLPATPARAGSPPTRPRNCASLHRRLPAALALDAADTLAFLCTSPYDVRLAQERFPKIHFHPLARARGAGAAEGGLKWTTPEALRATPSRGESAAAPSRPASAWTARAPADSGGWLRLRTGGAGSATPARWVGFMRRGCRYVGMEQLICRVP